MSIDERAADGQRRLWIAARPGRYAAALAGTLVLAMAGASPALAGPWWRLSSRAAPTSLPPGGKGLILAVADNLGDAGVKGSTTTPVTIKDTLAPGLKINGIHPHEAHARQNEEANWSCSVAELREVRCTTPLAVPPYETLQVEITVEVDEPPGTVTSLSNEMSVAGGEAEEGGPVLPSSLSRPVTVNGAPTPFGVEPGGYTLTPENEGGSLDSQAGSHPFQLTSTVELNQTLEAEQKSVEEKLVEVLRPTAPALSKNLSFKLPPGLLGNVTAAQRCSEVEFSALEKGATNRCPPSSAIGIATASVTEPYSLGYLTVAVPLFNLEPAPGEPARFGFEAEQVPVILDTSVRTGGDYGVTVSVNNATGAAQVLGAQVTLWGVPGDRRHDQSRGWSCINGGFYKKHGNETCEAPKSRSTVPFLTLPTSCTGQLSTSVEGDSWTGDPLSDEYTLEGSLGGLLERLEGCGELPFDPSLGVQPEQQTEQGRPEEHTSSASTPTGLSVGIRVPQEGTLEEGGLGDSDVRSTTVTLPAGVELSPSAANGLEACSEAQVGFEGMSESDPLSQGAPAPLRFSTAPATCPEASKVGVVHVKTPLLDEELQGGVYLAAQDANPFGSLIALYIVAENPILGVRVKLAGEARLNDATGQISTTFAGTPQVPFEELRLQLFGGPRGSISTPALCGSYSTSASFTPWSGGETVAVSSQPFDITSGAGGGPCPPDPLAFAPSFEAGSSSLQAGGFSPFSLTLRNRDGDQALSGLAVHLPPGVAALISSVTPCSEARASRDECGPESLIGHSMAQSGLGSEPVSLPGSVYLTGPYEGAPFGIEVVTPAVAGPFNLGDVDVRSRINVDPHTAAVSITSDAFPTFVKGIPVALKQINVTVDRPGFEFNPTNCDPMAITGTLSGAQGATSNVSSPFQVANCGALPFKPALTAAAGGRASKGNGTSFAVKVVTAGLGQANIAKVDLQLPKALPARLTTIQKACVAAVFEANPASCGEGSLIGTATIHTPVLKSPLRGPAYLVSHGGAAFPDVEFVLQGEGVTVILDGKTDIKHGITYSRFESAPDAPFTSFETVLPAGPHSALTANVPEKQAFDLCGSKPSAPTEITAQDGVLIKQNTPIALTGCGGVKGVKARKLTRAQKLAKALKACRKKHNKTRRATCETHAHKQYGPKEPAHKHARR